jgi:hypothetical protein
MSTRKINNYLAITLLLLLLNEESLFGQSQKNFQKYSVDPKISIKLEKLKKESDLAGILTDNAFWFLFDNEIFTLLDEKDNPQHFLDTTEMLEQVPCDCMIKNDTVYIQGGIGYEGSIGFSLKIINNLYEGNVWLTGKDYQTTNGLVFNKEVFLRSVHQSLIIENRNSLRLGGQLKGKLTMESENYSSKEDKTSNKIYMKLLFDCKLDDSIL